MWLGEARSGPLGDMKGRILNLFFEKIPQLHDQGFLRELSDSQVLSKEFESFLSGEAAA